jgi:uncharacterized protein
MQPARYLHSFPSEDGAEVLLFALPGCATLLMPTKHLQAFMTGQVPAEAARDLRKAGFLVTDQAAEKARVIGFIDQLNRINPLVRVSIILNMVCNFACQYCYEGSQKGDHQMDIATADLLIAALKERFKPPHKKKMVLDLYGGEPLLSVPMIKYLAGRLQPWVENQGGRFEFTLVTNGSLLTRPTVEGLVALGLARARVTIDGPAENHNRYRPFKEGQASYEIIMKNVAACRDLIKIAIGGNFTRDNYRKFPLLLDDLQARGLNPDQLPLIKFTQVTKTNDRFAPKFNEGCGSIDEPWLAEAVLFLREEILRRGYQTPKPLPNICMIETTDSFTVHYDGFIYKCPGLIGNNQFIVGHVGTGIGEYRQTYALDNWRSEAKCRECTYLPLCFGGCRYANYQRTGVMAGVECMKDHYDKTLGAMLAQDRKYRR